MEVLVFVSSTCPHCPVAWKNAQQAAKELPDVSFKKIRTKTSEGKRLSKQFNIMSVPSFVFIDGDDIQDAAGAISVDSIKQYVNKEEKKSFFSRLLNK